MQRIRTFSVCIVTTLILTVMTLVTSGGVFAASISATTSSHQPHFYYAHANNQQSAIPQAKQTIPYNGGPVMKGSVAVFTIFWQPKGSKVGAGYNSLINRFFNDFTPSTIFHIATQYKDSTGGAPSSVTLGGSWVDTRAYPGSFISDSQLQAEVSLAMKTNAWKASLQHAFFVFPVASEPICFDSAGSQCSGSSFCAYHDTFGSNVIYAAMPDLRCGTPTSPNNNPEAENVIDSGSHELMEAMTDPLLNAWTSNSLGEIGDPCSTSYPAPNPAFNNGDITGNGHFYMLQEEWSNAAGGCSLK